MSKDLTDFGVKPVEDVPADELGIERDRAVDARLRYQDAAYHLGEMFVTLDGIADSEANEEFIGAVREMQRNADLLESEADAFAEAWKQREAALRKRIAKRDYEG